MFLALVCNFLLFAKYWENLKIPPTFIDFKEKSKKTLTNKSTHQRTSLLFSPKSLFSYPWSDKVLNSFSTKYKLNSTDCSCVA